MLFIYWYDDIMSLLNSGTKLANKEVKSKITMKKGKKGKKGKSC